MKIQYYMPERGQKKEDAYSFEWPIQKDISNYGYHCVAEMAAEDFHQNHNGWECTWPITFVLLREDGSEIGMYEVEREAQPVFNAYKKGVNRE